VRYNLGINYKKEGRFVFARYYLERAAKLYGYESTLGKLALDKFKTSDKEKSKKTGEPSTGKSPLYYRYGGR
jgi:hypothetical protein